MSKNLADIWAKWEKDSKYRVKETMERLMSTDKGYYTIGVSVLDRVLGGYPKGRITEIYSLAGVGKTTLILCGIKKNADLGYKTLYLDYERGLRGIQGTEFLGQLGLTVGKDIFLMSPETLEDAEGIVQEALQAKDIGLIVFDSAAWMIPKKIINESLDEKNLGLQSRLLGDLTKKLSVWLDATDTTAIFINQMRANMSFYKGAGQDYKVAGGEALKFAASLRLELKLKEALKEGTDRVGSLVEVEAIKNKSKVPFRKILIPLIFGKGIDETRLIKNDLVETGLVLEKSAGWYETCFSNIPSEKIQGEKNLLAWMRQHQDLVSAELAKFDFKGVEA